MAKLCGRLDVAHGHTQNSVGARAVNCAFLDMPVDEVLRQAVREFGRRHVIGSGISTRWPPGLDRDMR